MSEKILSDTIRLLKKDKGSWAETARETGLGYEWIKKLAANAIGEPGHTKIIVLHSYLDKKYSAKRRKAA